MIPSHAPFSPEQSASLSALISGFCPEQSSWLSGYLAGLGSSASTGPVNLTVAYGTESGNSEELAARTVKAAKGKGIKAVLKNLADLNPADLAKAENLAVIISTWGDGEPPETVEGFYNTFIKESPDMKGLRFSICALGDTSYEKYCEIGKVFDERLEKLGGERITAREDCDVDFEEAYSAWLDRFLSELGGGGPVAVAQASVTPAVEYGKKKSFSLGSSG